MISMILKYFSHKEPNTYELRVEYKLKNQSKAEYCIVTDVVAYSAYEAIKLGLEGYSDPKNNENMIVSITKL